MRPRWRDCAKQARRGRRHREGPFIDSRAPLAPAGIGRCSRQRLHSARMHRSFI
ncbi:hypothetical protein LG3211_0511 [Lysobacter gummosus]|nr:hypothetical protein LG3211_0511 [Lysobacter gummosus]